MGFDKDKFINWLKNYSGYQELSVRATEVFTGWTVKDMTIFFSKAKGIVQFLNELTDLVEKFARDIDDLSSKDKQDALKEGLDDLIQLPKMWEWADNVAINAMVAAIVESKNKYIGQDWFKDE